MPQHEPYFPVLGADGNFATEGGADSRAAFFATGEADIAALIATINALPVDLSLDSVLDFGCGAGRLSLPLAARARQVIACDIAPAMLVHARDNARNAGAANVEFLLNDELMARANASFSFICSLSVFQYIGAADGYRMIRSLARMLAPEGVAAIQLRFRSAQGSHASVYNERRVVTGLTALGVEPVARLPIDDHDSVLIVRRLRTSCSDSPT